MSIRSLASFALALFMLAACSSSSSSDGEPGTAPTASGFTLSPTTVDVGKQATLIASLDVQDPDGDLEALVYQVTAPNGEVQPESRTDITAVGSATSAKLPIKFIVPPLPIAGHYAVAMWVRDKAGNVSGKQGAVLTAK